MTISRFLKIAVAAASLFAAGAHANLVTYSFTAEGNHAGTFSYNDAASSNGNGPYASGGTGYAATSFVVDGTSLAAPELVLYPNYEGSQFALFTAGTGYTDYLELASAGTHTFSSSAASQMDGKTLASFNYGYLDIRGKDYEVRSLAQVTAVPEPETYLLLLAGLAGMAFVIRRRRD